MSHLSVLLLDLLERRVRVDLQHLERIQVEVGRAGPQ